MRVLLKFNIIYVLIMFLIYPQLSKAQQWEWVKSFGGTGKCTTYGFTSDNEGNIILAGSFSGTVMFNDTKVSSNGCKDIFVAKYDTGGNLLWVKQTRGTKDNEAFGVACDKNDNIFITGYFSGMVKLSDDLSADCETGKNCFVIKYDKNGMIQWLTRTNGTSDKYGKSITIDNNGNILISGVFKNDMLVFYEGETVSPKDNSEDEFERSFALKSNGTSDIFIIKYSNNADLLWAAQSKGDGSNEAAAIVSDKDGNCYITGSFTGKCSYGDNIITSKGGKDIFISKFDSTGKVVWAKQMGGSVKDDQSCGMDIDKNGFIYLTGNFSESVSFGNDKLISIGNDALFVTKMDNKGNSIWAKQIGGIGSKYASGIKADSKGNVYITGDYNTAFDFGNNKISNAGDRDMFVLNFDDQGKMLKAYHAGGIGSDKGFGITINNKNDCFILGTIGKEAKFGNNSIKGLGDADNFIGKIK